MSIARERENISRAASWLMPGVVGGLGLDLAAKELLQTYPLVQFVLLRSSIAIVSCCDPAAVNCLSRRSLCW